MRPIYGHPSTSKDYRLKLVKPNFKQPTSSPATSLTNLPDDVLVEIFQKIETAKDIHKICEINKKFASVLWKNRHLFVRSKIDGIELVLNFLGSILKNKLF